MLCRQLLFLVNQYCSIKNWLTEPDVCQFLNLQKKSHKTLNSRPKRGHIEKKKIAKFSDIFDQFVKFFPKKNNLKLIFVHLFDTQLAH